MKHLHFESAFLPDGWANDVLITIDDSDTITDIATNKPAGNSNIERVPGIAIPGMVNVHSHAFQRAFAGLSEYRTGEHDSFWTWRKLMYEFVETLAPEQIYETAFKLYSELRKSGYTWVGEFHYIHNAPDGKPYDDPTCLADAVIRAAIDARIGICILPVLYQRGGFNNEPLTPAQRRFYLDEDAFLNLASDLKTRHSTTPNVEVGIAFHSLRAVSIRTIQRMTGAWRAMYPNGVIHIHVAEQTKEVEDCLAATGRRSVEFLTSEIDVDEDWCLIHATHLNEAEVLSIVNSKATVGLCPTTEANLGDGVFPAPDFLNSGGHIAIGSDSHVSVSPRSELRLLEYGQRLTRQSRAVLGTRTTSVGTRLYTEASISGARAIGVETGSLQVGHLADIVVLDRAHPTLSGCHNDRVLDRFVFCDAGNPVC